MDNNKKKTDLYSIMNNLLLEIQAGEIEFRDDRKWISTSNRGRMAIFM